MQLELEQLKSQLDGMGNAGKQQKITEMSADLIEQVLLTRSLFNLMLLNCNTKFSEKFWKKILKWLKKIRKKHGPI